MNACHGATAGVVEVFEGAVPGERFGGGAGNGGYGGHAAGSTFAGEVFLKDAAIVVFFLVSRRVDGEAFGGVFHLLVADSGGSDFFQCVDPRIADAVGELFFLSPSHAFGKIVCKGFAENLLFDGLSRAHFGFGVEPHGDVKEFFVQEGHASFDTPRREALVGAQTVVEVEF